jgi:hypothetical protein
LLAKTGSGRPEEKNRAEKHGVSTAGDFVWRTEQALGVSQWKDLFETKLAKRFPTFGAMLKINSSTSGWGSCEGCDFTQNIFLNNTHKFALSSRNATTGAIIALYDDDALTEGAACIDGSGSVDAEWSDFQVNGLSSFRSNFHT